MKCPIPEACCAEGVFLMQSPVCITLSPVEYLTAEYSSFKTFEKTIIIINLDPPQTSKQIYRKLKYREKVLEEF